MEAGYGYTREWKDQLESVSYLARPSICTMRLTNKHRLESKPSLRKLLAIIYAGLQLTDRLSVSNLFLYRKIQMQISDDN